MNTSSDRSIQDIADDIEKNKEAILELFQKKLNQSIELPENLTTDTLAEVIPKQIDELIRTLIKFSKTNKPINTLAAEHVRMRASNKVFTLEILISEFIILRDVIFEILEMKGPVDVKASNIIWKFIVNSIRVAVMEFEKERMNKADVMNDELDESKVLNERISSQIQTSHENEERYRTLVDGVEDYAVFTVDPGGYITSWNPGAERMKGYTLAEILGKHFSLLYTKDGVLKDEPMQHLHTALIEGRYRGEGLRQRKNGEIFLADVYIKPIYKNKKHLGFAKVVADVTERNHLMQAANISKTEITDLKSEKQQREKFVVSLAHDLRGPLSVARASIELIGRNMDINDHNRRFLDKSFMSIDRINKMISDLLDANKIVAGQKIQLNLHEWDLVRLTRNVCEDFKVLGSQIVMHCEINELKGQWDGEGIRRVLENLLSNAVKYGDISAEISVKIIDLGDKACIKVHNLGEVIKENDKQSLFDQFRRAETSKNKAQGWGIGLSLVKGITEAHGGTVEVESFPIEGTTFTINLPKNSF